MLPADLKSRRRDAHWLTNKRRRESPFGVTARACNMPLSSTSQTPEVSSRKLRGALARLGQRLLSDMPIGWPPLF